LLQNLFTLLTYSFILYTSEGRAAACCGAGFTAPSIITSDDAAQIAISYQYAQIYADVNSKKKWRKRQSKDVTQTFKIEGARLLSDRWQWGFSLPLQMRKRENRKAYTGAGDFTVQIAYEILPDWDYNPWRPRGIIYLAAIAPTGRSIYDSRDGSGLDARGRGFWGIGLGSALTKSWGTIDSSLLTEVHYSFSKKLTSQRIKPSWGGTLNWGIGKSFGSWRLGINNAYTYEAPIDVEGTPQSQGVMQRFTSTSLVGSYLFDHNATLSLSYTDQTIFGSPINTALTRSVTLFYQKRWSR
jgi:hypothetical protein